MVLEQKVNEQKLTHDERMGVKRRSIVSEMIHRSAYFKGKKTYFR